MIEENIGRHFRHAHWKKAKVGSKLIKFRTFCDSGTFDFLAKTLRTKFASRIGHFHFMSLDPSLMMISGRSARKVEAAYEKLRSLVLDNQLRPNEHLQIGVLANRLKAGVTPLREALIRLTAEGLISSHPHRGFFVKVLTAAELNDLSQFAEILLRSSLQRNADRSCMEWPEEICSTGDAMRNRRSAEAGARAVELLYEIIVSTSGNSHMAQAIRNYNARVHTVLLIFVEQFETPEITFDYVLGIRDRLAMNDTDAVRRMLRQWFQTKADSSSRLIKEATAQAFAAQWPNEPLAPPPPVRLERTMPQK
jgi:DNA-binding GntR family transcriptional regulator